MLTPRPQRPTAYDLVRAVTPPLRDPLPQRSPLPAYDPHPEPTTERLHRPRVEFAPTPVAAQAGPGPDDCATCWCPRETHLQGYGEREGRCWRPGCDTDCERFKKVRQWPRRLWLAFMWAIGSLFAIELVVGAWLTWAAS